MDKRKSHAFGKEIYLLGKDQDGRTAWLEAPKWDCGWYWAFGYVETYTGAEPSRSRDIESHRHVDSSVIGRGNAKDGGYCHNPHASAFFTETTFNEEEGWELGELFASFYVLRKAADYFHQGGAHVASASLPDRKDADMARHINEKAIPAITARIIEILTPKA